MTKLVSMLENNKQKALLVAIMAFAFMLVASTAFGALTFTNDDITSDEDFQITGVEASTLSVTSGSAAEDLTVSVTGATDSSLVLSSTGTAADALQITASAGGIDIAASGAAAGEDIDITATGSSINITATESDANGIVINASGAAGGVNMDSGTGGVLIDSTGIISIDGADDVNLTVTAGAAGEDLTISEIGAFDASVILTSAGTGTDAIGIHATAGGIDIDTASTAAAALDIDATGTVAGNAITVNTTDGGIAIGAAGADNGDLTLTVGDDYVANVTGIWDNNVTGAATLDAASISLDATTASNFTVTGAGADLTLASVLGSVAISSTEDVASSISLTANSAGTNDTIVITNTPGTAVGAITLTATAGGVTLTGGVASADAVNISASNAAGGIDIDSGTGGIIADSTGIISIDGADDVNLTVTASTAGEDLTISEIGAFDASVILTSAGTGTDAIGIHATAGGIDIDTASTAAAALDIDATGTVAGNAITVDTTDGGIAIVAAGAANGDITLTAGDDFTVNGAATSLYNIGAATTSGTIIIGGTAQTGLISIGDTATSVVTEISIGGGNGDKTAINIGDGTGANGINIGTGDTGVKTIAVGTGAAANVITIGSENGAASLEFRYGTGALIVSPTPNTTVVVDEVAFLNFSLAGGGATEAETATGLRTSAVVVCSPISVTNAVNWQEAVVTANTITFTFSADPGASTVGCMIHNI